MSSINALQADIEAADERLLKLGLLFAADMDVSLEDQPEYYSFHHKLIQEHLAARFLTQRVQQDRESFSTVFPHWKDIRKSYEKVVKFMVGMDASIIDHVCKVYADHVIQERYLRDADLLFLKDLQIVSISNTSSTNPSSLTLFDCDPIKGRSHITLGQALLSSYIVLVKDAGSLLGLLPHTLKTDMHDTCQPRTRALFIGECSYENMQQIMKSIDGIPITHLFMEGCDINDSDILCAMENYDAETSDESGRNSLVLCRQAQAICLKMKTLPWGLLHQLGQQLHGCQQLHTLCLIGGETVVGRPDSSVTPDLPGELVTAMVSTPSLTHLKIASEKPVLTPAKCEILCKGLSGLGRSIRSIGSITTIRSIADQSIYAN